MSIDPENAQQLRYVEITRRLNTITIIGATCISSLMVIESWGAWRNVAIIAAVQLVLIPFNMLVNLVLLKRWGVQRMEVLRTAVNLGGTIVGGSVAGWPFAMWLWLPFVAISFDQFSPRISWAILIVLTLTLDVMALSAGLPWIHALAFTFLAVFAAHISRVKHSIIRDMVLRSDEHRLELELAHAETRSAHDALKQEVSAREAMELELHQAQKLEAIGRLASGIAHEINTPVQFVNDSINFVRTASLDLLQMIERYRAVLPEDLKPAMAEAEEDLDLAYLTQHVPQACERSVEGLQRIATIVRSMKEFAHPDQQMMSPADLNSAIRSTLIIARSEYKDLAEVGTELSPLPFVECHVGQINQVILNLLVNAAHAIGDLKQKTRGQITVKTRLDTDFVVVDISDTGGGIPKEIQHRIFEPFFTTKGVGRGTGQGLAIARSVMKRHGGTLTFESTLGVGTTFTIRLPLMQTSKAQVSIAPPASRPSAPL